MTEQATTQTTADRPEPSRWMVKIANPIMALLLKSPLHGLLSGSLMLITFSGRKTGRQYTTPVAYQREGDTLTVFTHSAWWRNMRGGAPVTLRLQGKTVRATARPVTDTKTILAHTQKFIGQHGPENARRIGITLESAEPTVEELRQAVQGTVIIQIQLSGESNP